MDGTTYYERAVRLLAELKEANDVVMSRDKPRGKLTISAPHDFGHLVLAQWIPTFLKQYPKLQIDLQLTDRLVDLLEEGIDVAIRMGTLEDISFLVFIQLPSYAPLTRSLPGPITWAIALIFSTISYLQARRK
jgi:DNA-binding transcriptional LysR family regulator